jgi:drug/metabolite transporter (DMT)-like permease
VRIHSFNAKLGYWLVAFLATVGVFVIAGLRSDLLADALTAVLFVAAAVTAARSFRGAGESDLARPWWQFTATPGIGFLVGALSVVSGVAYMIEDAGHWMGGIAQLLVGLALLHSSSRLRRRAAGRTAP